MENQFIKKSFLFGKSINPLNFCEKLKKKFFVLRTQFFEIKLSQKFDLIEFAINIQLKCTN